MNSRSSKIPPPVAQLDAVRLLADLDQQHGVRLELVAPAPGGAVGAAFIRWPDGRDGVLTTSGDGRPETGEHLRRAAEVLALARSKGIPVPRYDLIARIDDVHIVVQQRLAGTPPGRADAALVDRMITATEPWAGLLADRTDISPVSLHLTESGSGFCQHESLAHYDDRTRRLLGQIREIGRSGPDLLLGEDLVHLDYHGGNILVDADGKITGIIDWDGAARGDRWLSLVVLSFYLSRNDDPAVRERLRTLISESVPPDRLREYQAHLCLRQVDWMIRHHGPSEVDFWLGVADGLSEIQL